MRILDALGVTVAALDGVCAGPDFERALACDVRLAADTARVSADGVADLAACARRLARLLGEARAKDMLLTGREVDAREALRLGIVTRVVPAAALAEEARALTETIASRPPLAVAAVKDAIGRARDLTPAAALALEQAHFCRLIPTRDHRTAVQAFFARRPGVFTGE